MKQTPSTYKLADHLCMGVLVLVLLVFAWGFSMHGLLYVVQPAGGAEISISSIVLLYFGFFGAALL